MALIIDATVEGNIEFNTQICYVVTAGCKYLYHVRIFLTNVYCIL